MAPVREVYNYVITSGIYDNVIPLAAPSTSIGTTLTNTSEIRNKPPVTFYDNKKNPVGKMILNKTMNYFENKEEGYVGNTVYLFNDGSYVMVLKFSDSIGTDPKPNAKFVNKAISTGGKYAGKDVTVTLKVGSGKDRKVILEYEN